MTNSLWPHELQHVRLPCPSLLPRVCSHSCPLSWWCYLTVSSFAVLFSFCLQSYCTFFLTIIRINSALKVVLLGEHSHYRKYMKSEKNPLYRDLVSVNIFKCVSSPSFFCSFKIFFVTVLNNFINTLMHCFFSYTWYNTISSHF